MNTILLYTISIISMLTLITLAIFSIVGAFFATQNTQGVSLNLPNYTLTNIPMYFIVLGSLLIGLLISSVINLVSSISSSLTIHGKDVKIKKSTKTVAELTKRIHQLELENTRLKTQQGEIEDDKEI